MEDGYINMAKNYINQPPQLDSVFIKSFPSVSVRALTAWAEREHYAMIQYFSSRGKYAVVKFLSDEYSYLRFIAELPDFKELIWEFGKDECWKKLDRRGRQVISRAYELSAMIS